MTSCCTIWIQIKTTTYLKWLFAKSYSVILRNFTIFSTVLPNHIFPLMPWATLQNRTFIVFCTNFNIVNVVPNCAMSFWTYWSSSSSSSTIFFKTANNKMKTQRYRLIKLCGRSWEYVSWHANVIVHMFVDTEYWDHCASTTQQFHILL